MSTKEKILEKSLELFNLFGTDQVKVRHIAKELGISHGNLCYHYSTTDDIIEALYYRLTDKLEDSFEANLHNVPSLTAMLSTVQDLFVSLGEYKFLILDFVRVMRRNPKIRKNYQVLRHTQGKILLEVIRQLQFEGILRSDLPQSIYDSLVELFLMLTDSWIIEAEVMFEGNKKEKERYYLQTCTKMLYPYLTTIGLRQLEIAKRKKGMAEPNKEVKRKFNPTFRPAQAVG